MHHLLRRHIAFVTAQVSDLLDAVVTACVRRFRSPFALDALAVAITAVAQGLEPRVAIEPERVPVSPLTGGRADDGGVGPLRHDGQALFEAFTEPAD